MDTQTDQGRPTRMLFLGEERLADGFRLIGFEVHPDPTPEEVERLLRGLERNRERAFVVVDDAVMRAAPPTLALLRREGGRIVVIAVPRLTAPPVLSSDVAQRLTKLFGAATLGNGGRS